VFCFGCNGVEVLRARCESELINVVKAELKDHARCFAGSAPRWEGGGVASCIPMEGQRVLGSVAYMTEAEIARLDRFELGDAAVDKGVDPYGHEGVYRRYMTDSVLIDGAQTPSRAMLYVKNDLTWEQPPGLLYLRSILANMRQFWDVAELEVRRGDGTLVETWSEDTGPNESGGGDEHADLVRQASVGESV
jgi:hypothetical protein